VSPVLATVTSPEYGRPSPGLVPRIEYLPTASANADVPSRTTAAVAAISLAIIIVLRWMKSTSAFPKSRIAQQPAHVGDQTPMPVSGSTAGPLLAPRLEAA
jgi:hypothetical protein